MPWIDELSEEQREALPEDIRTNEMLNRFDSMEALLSGFVETKSLVGQSIRVPPEEAGDEARSQFIDKLVRNAPELMLKPDWENPEQNAEFWRTLGTPEDAEGYENPEGVEVDEEVEKQLRSVLHSANLTPAQYQTTVKQLSEMHQQATQQAQSKHEEEMNSLYDKWGMTKKDRLAAAKKVSEEFFGDVPFDKLSAKVVEGLYAMSVSLKGKGAQVAHQPQATSETLTPAEALERAAEIINNPDYWDKSKPDVQQRLVKKRLELLKMAGYSDDLDAMRA